MNLSYKCISEKFKKSLEDRRKVNLSFLLIRLGIKIESFLLEKFVLAKETFKISGFFVGIFFSTSNFKYLCAYTF